jgi:S1-C subfamily serine protease
MYGVKKLILTLLFLFPSHLFAYPPQSELFGLSESMTHIWVTFKDGVTGTGSGIVVKKNHVATNCHVLADSRGVNAVKYFKTYVPIAIYADWENDLCILKFDDLPLPPVKLGILKTSITKIKFLPSLSLMITQFHYLPMDM